jgi:hypothetical protein
MFTRCIMDDSRSVPTNSRVTHQLAASLMIIIFLYYRQGILKGEVSLYH